MGSGLAPCFRGTRLDLTPNPDFIVWLCVMKKIIASFAVLTVLAVMAGQIDDDLSDTALNLIDSVDYEVVSESYFYLTGIVAAKGDDPIKAGRDILASQSDNGIETKKDVGGYPSSKRIALPTGKAFCKINNDGCLEYLFSSDIDYEDLIKNHKLLVDRSIIFLDYREFNTAAKPGLDSPPPPYPYLIAAERIKTVEAISHYKKGSPLKAVDQLSSELSSLRSSMALQDNLIGRLVFLSMISEILDVMSIVISDSDIESEFIPPLTQEEKSLSKASAREFAMSYHLFEELDRNPEFFEMGGNLPGWVTRLFYKPNMTINAVAPFYEMIDRLATLDPDAFVEQAESPESLALPERKIRNYSGSVLAYISVPDVYSLAGRVHEVDIKIDLFNKVHHLGLSENELKSPYGGIRGQVLRSAQEQ